MKGGEIETMFLILKKGGIQLLNFRGHFAFVTYFSNTIGKYDQCQKFLKNLEMEIELQYVLLHKKTIYWASSSSG